MIQWFVAHTQAQQERLAQQHLLKQGFEVYLPLFKKQRRHARKVQEILSPLFPRYIFIGMNIEQARWRSINGTRGIAYLLMHENKPATIASPVIQALQTRENTEGVVPLDSVALFNKGDRVRVLEGAFTDQTVVFTAWDDKQRVQLLLDFLGRETTISLPAYAVSAV